MHLFCQQHSLSQGLATVNHALPTKQFVLSILSNVLIVADSEAHTLKLSATNLEIGITLQIDAEILEPGAITLPGKLLHEFVQSLSDARVEIRIPGDSTTAHITTAHNKATIRGMDAAEFPTLPTCDANALPILLDAALLKESINQVAFAAALDESRPILTGVLVQFHAHEITLAAANTFRLAVRRANQALTDGEHAQSDILIPAKSMIELARLLPDNGEVEMTVTSHRDQVLFHMPKLDLLSRLIEGTFPAYQGIIPAIYTTRVVVDRIEFGAAIKSAAFFADGSSRILRISVKPSETDLGNGSVLIDTSTEDKGDGQSTLDASVEGPAVQMVFGSTYLTDALAALSTPTIALETTTDAKPGVLKPVGEKAVPQLHVIMPMHTLN